MTLSFGRLASAAAHFLGQFASVARYPRLDLRSLSERDIRDLNLPIELKGRLSAARDIECIRRRF
jgi:hypothetical protein